MGTPATRGLELLARTTPLTDLDWHALLEARRRFMAPFLDSFTLKTLGEVECLKDESFWHRIDPEANILGDERFNLKTQGIFRWAADATKFTAGSSWANWFSEGQLPAGTTYAWGLTRSGLWVFAKIDFVGAPGRKHRGYEKAECVTIQKATSIDVSSVAKVTPETMWLELGREARRWEENRERLWKEATELRQRIGAEELMVALAREVSR